MNKTIKQTRLYKYIKIIKILIRKLIKKISGSAVILLYHRIDDVEDDPLLLCVSPKKFEEQLTYLKQKYNIISLNELARRIKEMESLKNCVVITFDDGYEDNYTKALPILKKMNIPATFFITAPYNKNVFDWEKITKTESQGKPIKNVQISLLSDSPLIEIGGHTINHPKLSDLNKEKQINEILGNKKFLEEITKKSIVSFSYPFGSREDYNKDTEEIVAKNFEIVCINEFGYINLKSHLHKLPRNLVRNWDIKDFKKYSL